MTRPLPIAFALSVLAAVPVLAVCDAGRQDEEVGVVAQGVAGVWDEVDASVRPHYAHARRDPVVVAAGDIACGGDDYCRTYSYTGPETCRDRETAALVDALAPDLVLALGDLQYSVGTRAAFLGTDPTTCARAPAVRGYVASWGRFLPITRPALGNHEYGSSRGPTWIRDNFAEVFDPEHRGLWTTCGDRDYERGYYSFDAPTSDPASTWHVVVLNSGKCDCIDPAFCAAASEQVSWLRADLAAHPARCTLAVWHHPYFSTPHRCEQNLTRVAPFWAELHAAGADLIVNGHDHAYERFAPQRPDGTRDDDAGITQITVGTGGRETTPCVANTAQRCVTACFDQPANGKCLRIRCDGGAESCTCIDREYNANTVVCRGASSTDERRLIDSGTDDAGKQILRSLNGVLRLVLRPDRAEYQYVRDPGSSDAPPFEDELVGGTVLCH